MQALAQLLSTRTEKRYSHGTHRCRTPAETWAAVRPHLAEFGITRVANLTGLDRIGIPVFQAVRPNSRSLSVAQGKGADVDGARVSAVMESIECYHAEFATCPVRIECHEQLLDHAVLAPEALPRAQGSPLPPGCAIPWTLGWDLQHARPAWVPYELVHANATRPLVPGSGYFVRSTNGLASGNTLAEAVLHGLLELIERDALALWEAGGDAVAARTRIDLDSVDDPLGRGLLDRFEAADFDVMLWSATSDLGVPVFRSVIVDRSCDTTFRPLPACIGTGCHLDRGVALSRALTEAAQSRLTTIAGARDEHTRAHRAAAQAPGTIEHFARIARATAGAGDFGAVASSATDSPEGDLRLLLGRLAAAGTEGVVAIDLSRPGLPIAVARTVVAGLEGPSDHVAYRPGRRALALLGART